jgi:predicted HAD superfamily Cof-like phosphohydrolase
VTHSDFNDVRIFHTKFSLPVDDGSPPTLLESNVMDFRFHFMEEERSEYMAAYHHRDLVKAVDALIDFVYVTFGTALFMRAASPVLSPYPIHTDPWPAFDRVKNYASTRGFPIERSPRLLSYALHDIMEKVLFYDLKMFKIAHTNRQMNFSLAHLRDAVFNAYLVASLMNVPWSTCWAHVQAANINKIRAHPSGSDSKRLSPWDVIKPPGWRSPDPLIHSELIKVGAQFDAS